MTATIWPASGFSLRLPSLACSSDQYSMSNMSASSIDLEASERFRVRDRLDRGLGEVGGDAGVLRGAAETKKAEPGHQHHARQRIEHFLPPPTRALLLSK